MDMNDVAVFVKVVEAGSFTGAAKLLKQPKTTVSRKVARLEEALGARLLQRTTRSVSLTDTGQRFYRACSDALAAIDTATRSVGEEHGVPSGTIRVSAPADAYFLSEIVAAFLARYERMKVEVVLTDARLNLIEQGIDLAFRAGPLEDSTLVARRLVTSRRICCAGPAYLEKRGAPMVPSDLKDHDCIIYRGRVDGATWTLDGKDGPETVVVRGRLAADTMRFVIDAAVAGIGIARVPAGMVSENILDGSLTTVLDDFARKQTGMFVVYPSGRHLSAAVRAFVELAIARIAAMPDLHQGAANARAKRSPTRPPRSRRLGARVREHPS